jgi:hypothetical protein
MLLALLFLFTGCHATKMVYRDRGFDAAALQAGGLAVVAVTRPEFADYYAAPYIAERVEEQLKRAWPGLAVLPLKEVRQLLGETNHFQLEEAFRGPAVLPEDKFPLLQPLNGKVRYALLIDVREDNASNDYGSSVTRTETQERDPKTGEVVSTSVETEYSAGWSFYRHVKALFIIYDLDTRQHVWIALGSDEGSHSTSATSSIGIPGVREAAGIAPQDLMEAISRRVLRKVPVIAKSAGEVKTTVAGE